MTATERPARERLVSGLDAGARRIDDRIEALADGDGIGRVLDAVRRPEYTGENRCLPCTVTNVGLAGLGSLAVARRSKPAGAALFAGSLAAIGLRGYLVPYTPTLTARYFPEWLLELFEKESTGGEDVDPIEADTVPEPPEPVDIEAVLVDAGVLVEDATGTDVDLDPAFEAAWEERAVYLAGVATVDREALADLLDIEPDRLDVERYGKALLATREGEPVGQWESRAALVADAAASAVLAERYDGWEALSLSERAQVLGGLRMFVERCPVCGGRVELAPKAVRSCCRQWEVVAASCTGCGARLLELDRDTSAALLAAAGDGT